MEETSEGQLVQLLLRAWLMTGEEQRCRRTEIPDWCRNKFATDLYLLKLPYNCTFKCNL